MSQPDQKTLFYRHLISHWNHSASHHTDRDDDERDDENIRDDDGERDYAPNDEPDAADEYQDNKRDYDEEDDGIEE